jgi:D-3-phosphoglycerate dehydrogenase
MKKVLIIDDVHSVLNDRLEALGYQVIYKPEAKREEILDLIRDAYGLIVRSKTTTDKEMLDLATNLKFIGRCGAGLDLIDIDYARSIGVELVNAPEGNRDALGEHALGLSLALINNMFRSAREISGGQWFREANRGVEISSLTVGVLGIGFMGEAFARRAAALGARVIGLDHVKTGYSSDWITEVNEEQFKKETDLFSIHIPLDESNHHFVNTEYIDSFEKNIWLINTARGPVLDTVGLIKGLNSGKIKGAALDVWENEKLATHTKEQQEQFRFLNQHPDVLLTPHVGGWTFESYFKISDVLADKIEALGFHI